MESTDLALSDIHVDLAQSTAECRMLKNYNAFRSRFQFKFESEDGVWQSDCGLSECRMSGIATESQNIVGSEVVGGSLDEDGDLLLCRHKREHYEVINIEHTLATHLADVGLQVWPACLLLCDYIIDNAKTFDNAVVLELGAGVGLASIVAAMFARRVICTDIGKEILSVCARNSETNRHLYRHCDKNLTEQNVVKVRQLDWTTDLQTTEDSRNEYGLTDEDCAELYATQILLAADVIYSDELTDALFVNITDVMGKQPAGKTLFLSLEKRLNFTLAERDVACPAYTYYCRCLERLRSCELETGVKFEVCRLSTDFPQCFDYSRTKYLELWKISTT